MDDAERKRYLALELWTLREAAYLLCGQWPASDDEFKVEVHSGSEVAWAYRALKDATRAKTLDFIKADASDTFMRRLVSPPDALAWAKKRDMAIPPSLQPLAARRTARPVAPSQEADRPIKRATLIEKCASRWPSIERDLKDASKNGLSAAAKAEHIGFWREDAAVEWATARGKLKSGTGIQSWPSGKTTRNRI